MLLLHDMHKSHAQNAGLLSYENKYYKRHANIKSRSSGLSVTKKYQNKDAQMSYLRAIEMSFDSFLIRAQTHEENYSMTS